MKPLTFGEQIRALRLRNLDYTSLRHFAAKVGLSPAYLSRIENGKEPPPSEAIIERLAEALGADRYELLSLAGRVPSEFFEIFCKNPPRVASFLRTASRMGIRQDKDWNHLEKELLGIKKPKEDRDD